MLIPGLPPLGAQPEVTRPKRGVTPTEKTPVVHETLAEPVERRRRNKKRVPDRRRGRKRASFAAQTEYSAEGVAEMSPELPAKGLLIDIEI
ncbi:hypothetical protein [Pseudomonas profundi]|uniref:hypothetical protein n=1 Tax=Pseudomonas profundi TaxID=1981513 RepID=UPI0016815633|nr:hypothetical protein [Pseudomonas profundi]